MKILTERTTRLRITVDVEREESADGSVGGSFCITGANDALGATLWESRNVMSR